MYYIYILFSEKVNRYYVGESEDPNKRLESHLSGISKYTSIADGWKIVYTESFTKRTEAIKRENQIKKKKSRKYIEWLIDKDVS